MVLACIALVSACATQETVKREPLIRLEGLAAPAALVALNAAPSAAQKNVAPNATGKLAPDPVASSKLASATPSLQPDSRRNEPQQIARAEKSDREWNNIAESGCHFTCQLQMTWSALRVAVVLDDK